MTLCRVVYVVNTCCHCINIGLCSEDVLHSNTRTSQEHSGGLLEAGLGEGVGSHCHANTTGGERKGLDLCMLCESLVLSKVPILCFACCYIVIVGILGGAESKGV